jgi:hypothetical protein
MSVAGNDNRGFPDAELNQRPLKGTDLLRKPQDFFAQPQAHIQCHLIIARPACVQLGSRRDAPRQLRLDVHVNVFQLRSPTKFARLDFFPYDIQPLDNCP